MSDAPTTVADEPLSAQVERLANVIMFEIPGEPSQSEGAIDTAIRLLRAGVSPQPEITTAHDVIRRLRTGWEPDIPCIGPGVWCWFHPDTDEPEPMTAAEVAVIEATKEPG